MINICLRPEHPRLLFPIGLGYVASAVKKAGFDLEILDVDAYRYTDEEVEQFIKEKDYDVVAFGCIVTGYKIVKKLAETIKKHKRVPIVCGNSVASSIPELLLSRTKVDIAVIGEGDITIVELLKAIEEDIPLERVDGIYFKRNGKIISTPPRSVIDDLDEIPPINWDLFNMDIYISKSKYGVSEPYPMEFDQLKAMPINTARGCIYRCTFCYHVFRDNKYRRRSPKSICDEIKILKEKFGINYISFSDELTFFSIRQCEEFVDTMLKENLGVYWVADCRAGLFKENHIDIARKLKKAGCVGLGYSLESANEDILKAMHKKIKPSQFSTQAKVLRAAGIVTWTSLVIGYPQETEETIKQTFDCCYENDIYPSAGYLLPQPGTPIYDYAIEIGKIRDEEKYILSMGDRQDFTINLTQMEQSRIEQLVKENLLRISNKLNLGLDETRLIKTGHYRAKKAA